MNVARSTAIDRLETELRQQISGAVRRDHLLAQHTSFNIGGPADLWIEPADLKDLAAAVRLAHRAGVSTTVLGLGSNCLVSDLGIRGAVICLKRCFRNLKVEGGTVTAGAGVTLPLLSQHLARLGLSGLEWACGIPGSVGGAVVMNAGAHGGDTSERLIETQLVDPEGQDAWVPASALDYSYRHSALQGGDRIVTAARFRLQPEDPSGIHTRLVALREKRRAAQPETSQCAGSIFRNPPGGSAGRLLESLGAKGMRVGGAEVSPRHANFIVNLGGAAAEDVEALIRRLQHLAREQAGVVLEPEVLFVGERVDGPATGG